MSAKRIQINIDQLTCDSGFRGDRESLRQAVEVELRRLLGHAESSPTNVVARDAATRETSALGTSIAASIANRLLESAKATGREGERS